MTSCSSVLISISGRGPVASPPVKTPSRGRPPFPVASSKSGSERGLAHPSQDRPLHRVAVVVVQAAEERDGRVVDPATDLALRQAAVLDQGGQSKRGLVELVVAVAVGRVLEDVRLVAEGDVQVFLATALGRRGRGDQLAGTLRRLRLGRPGRGCRGVDDGLDLPGGDDRDRRIEGDDRRATMRTLGGIGPLARPGPVQPADPGRIEDPRVDIHPIGLEPTAEGLEELLHERLAGVVVGQVHQQQDVEAVARIREGERRDPHRPEPADGTLGGLPADPPLFLRRRQVHVGTELGAVEVHQDQAATQDVAVGGALELRVFEVGRVDGVDREVDALRPPRKPKGAPDQPRHVVVPAEEQVDRVVAPEVGLQDAHVDGLIGLDQGAKPRLDQLLEEFALRRTARGQASGVVERTRRRGREGGVGGGRQAATPCPVPERGWQRSTDPADLSAQGGPAG